jgi:hypothetical protein
MVAALNRDAAVDVEGLLVRDPWVDLDPLRNDCGCESVDLFLKMRRRPTVSDEADTDLAIIGSDNSRGIPEPVISG